MARIARMHLGSASVDDERSFSFDEILGSRILSVAARRSVSDSSLYVNRILYVFVLLLVLTVDCSR
jgi:hypothetical protein